MGGDIWWLDIIAAVRIKKQLWGPGLVVVLLVLLFLVGLLFKPIRETGCQNQLYLLSAIAQSFAALVALLVASAAILMSSRMAVRHLAAILLREPVLQFSFVGSFSLTAFSLLLLRTGYAGWLLWLTTIAATGCLGMVAFAVYSALKMLVPEHFTGFLAVRVKRGDHHVYAIALYEWSERMFDQGVETLARKSFEALSEAALQDRELRFYCLDLLNKASERAPGNRAWRIVWQMLSPSGREHERP